ncbi:hypothetical protein HMPREF1146_0271 [Prevotella sp. MSX73]|nr:hypothetical protein HMPREF1146_0271 [Prevotella sp. MSX73]
MFRMFCFYLLIKFKYLFHTFYYFELNGKIIHELAFNHDFKVPIVA